MVELSYDDYRSLRLYLKEIAEESKVISKSLTKFANSKELTWEYFISKVMEYEVKFSKLVQKCKEIEIYIDKMPTKFNF